MAVTAAGTPYVESSDLVANYPGVSLALANHIDTLGKVLQVVRATDSTDRSTTATSMVDVTGMSVTITPSRNTSAILLISTFRSLVSTNDNYIVFQLTDASNVAISGAQSGAFGSSAAGATLINTLTIIGYATPATISATTYKLRFRSNYGAVVTIQNNSNTGQVFAIEVAA